MNIQEMSINDLLILHSSVLDELKKRKVVRTKNNPIGDYTEWLISKCLDLKLETNSSAGYDGIDPNGVKIQIKSRRITPDNKSRQLSAIRNYDKKDFDLLAAVIFDSEYQIIDAILIPHIVIGEYATYRKHVNAHILHLNDAIINDSRVKNIKKMIKNQMEKLVY